MTNTKRSTPVESGTASHIELKIPGRPEFVVVVRLAAAAIAGRVGLSYDDIEDLKVAVGEACSVAILAGAPDVAVSFEVSSDNLAVEITHRPAKAVRSAETELNRLLMQVLMDEVDSRATAAEHVTRMVKRVQR